MAGKLPLREQHSLINCIFIYLKYYITHSVSEWLTFDQDITFLVCDAYSASSFRPKRHKPADHCQWQELTYLILPLCSEN